MSNYYLRNSPDVKSWPQVMTPAGLMRFWFQDEVVYSPGFDGKFTVAFLEEDGGLVLSDGKTYVTPAAKCVMWSPFRGIPVDNRKGEDFALKEIKPNGKITGQYLNSWSTQASEVDAIIFESYINSLFSFSPGDIAFERKLFDARQSYLERVRVFKVEEEKFAEQTATDFAGLAEEFDRLYPQEKREYYPTYNPGNAQTFVARIKFS